MIKRHARQILEFMANPQLIGAATGIVLGTAFAKVIQSFMENLLSPILALWSADRNGDFFIVLRSGSKGPYKTVKEAEDDKAIILTYGLFIKSVFMFLLQAILIWYAIQILITVSNIKLLIPQSAK